LYVALTPFFLYPFLFLYITLSPPDQPIPFHHELAQTLQPPQYIFFYCDTPCENGGETPIIDSTAVYRFVKDTFPKYLDDLQKKGGVRYIRTLPKETDKESPIGRSWKETYQVSTKDELETKLQSISDCTYEWLVNTDDDIRITSPAIPAIRLVSDTTTQNYVYQYTFCNSIIAAYLGWQDIRNNRQDSLRFGDMSLMDESILQSIANFMNQHRILYKWKKGDIMAINNQLIMHSRNPFTGPRRVLASIWGPSTVLDEQPPNGIGIGIVPKPYKTLQPCDPLIFGFWKVPKDQCATVCYNAIKAGYRRLDCACDYGNEVQVGVGIANAIKDKIISSRSELFITSKLWNTFHLKQEHVLEAITKTLTDLQLDYLDEYLIHFPISMEYISPQDKYPPEWTNMNDKMVLVPNDITGVTWKAMELLVSKGLTKTIGVCNFTTQLLRQLLSTCSIRPSTLQIELHPENSQQKLIQFAHDAGIQVTAFSVLGSSSYVELNMATTADSLMSKNNNSIIESIAAAKKKTPAQILIRWAIQRNTLPITKTSNIKRLDENRNVFDFYLTPQEMTSINTLNTNKRYNDPGDFCLAAFGTYCPIYE
jgi:D-xylose reductase